MNTCPSCNPPANLPISFSKKVVSLAIAITKECKAALSGVPDMIPEEVFERLRICRECPSLLPNRVCSVCGCYTVMKACFRSQKCPEGKW